MLKYVVTHKARIIIYHHLVTKSRFIILKRFAVAAIKIKYDDHFLCCNP